MMRYALIIGALILIALGVAGGYYYWTNLNPANMDLQNYQTPVVVQDENVSETPSGDVEIDSMEAELNSLEVPDETTEITDQDLIGL